MSLRCCKWLKQIGELDGGFQISTYGTNEWFIDAFGLPVDQLSGLSTNNSMKPNCIQAGMELAGSSEAVAPTNSFVDNQWYNGNWNDQTNAGDNGSASKSDRGPIIADWGVVPASGNHGGQWNTCLNDC